MSMLPYENASSGRRAIEEIQKILKAFGATSVGVMEHYAEGVVLVQFEHHGQRVSLKASARGYAARWLKANPWNSRRYSTRPVWEARALEIGNRAVFSILRDWIKGQVAAVECGVMDFEAAFLAQILLPDGRTVREHVAENKWLKLEHQPDLGG